MNGLFDLTGKVAIVTGAARGLGRVYAEAFAQQGASLILVDREQQGLEEVASEISKKGTPCLWYRADITDETQVETAFQDGAKKLGRIDILMNNAGTARVNTVPELMDIEKWKFVIDVNVTGSYICAKMAGREMIKQKKGKIINISSISGS